MLIINMLKLVNSIDHSDGVNDFIDFNDLEYCLFNCRNGPSVVGTGARGPRATRR